MAKAKKQAADEALQQLEQIKKLTVVAMFSDDELLKHLVLKGGNALDLIHKISTRASVDIDFSMQNDFPGGEEAFQVAVQRAIERTFRAEGYEPFDIRIQAKPENLSPELATFWGGYNVEFKLIGDDRHAEFKGDLETLRRNAIALGRSTRFLIDVSKYEYTEGKEARDLDGYQIFVYSAQMMVCEKMRAICQQLPEYGPIIKRDRPGSSRARDFVDIHALMEVFAIDFSNSKNHELLETIFAAKRVPLQFLDLIQGQRSFHALSFPTVEATVKADVTLREFDFYFDFVLQQVNKLKPLWNV